MQRRKIVLIGAGSTTFTQRLLADLLHSNDPSIWEVALVDIDEEALQSIHRVARKMVAATGVEMPVSATLERREALPGADFVVTTIAVGGRRGWEADVKVPRQHGIFQPVGDTVMPGGISRALRMIPPMVAIAMDVRELCPRAHFFNYSNPMTAICTAVRQAAGVPIIGLCHGMHVAEGYLARFLGVSEGSVSTFGVGLNHLTFLTHIFCQGEDATPRIKEALAEQRTTLQEELQAKDEFVNWVSGRAPRYADDPFSWAFYEEHGVFPIMMDRHASEFFPERFPGGRYFGKTLGVDAYPIDKRIAWGDEVYADFVRLAHAEGPLPEDFFSRVPGEHEQLVEIMTSLLADGRRVFSVNMPNAGAVPNLPLDAVLELPAAATARGFCQLHAGPLPEHLAQIVRAKLAVIDLTVQAALSGSRDLFIEALIRDGSVIDLDAASRLADDLLAAHREHVPQFAA